MVSITVSHSQDSVRTLDAAQHLAQLSEDGTWKHKVCVAMVFLEVSTAHLFPRVQRCVVLDEDEVLADDKFSSGSASSAPDKSICPCVALP